MEPKKDGHGILGLSLGAVSDVFILKFISKAKLFAIKKLKMTAIRLKTQALLEFLAASPISND